MDLDRDRIETEYREWRCNQGIASIKEWLEAERYNDSVVVAKHTMNRMLAHAKRHNCVIISAERSLQKLEAHEREVQEDENWRNTSELRDYLMKHYDATELEGYWTEEGQEEPDVEVSFFASNHKVEGDDGGVMFDKIAKLAKMYNQDSFIGTIPEVGGPTGLEDRYRLKVDPKDEEEPEIRQDLGIRFCLFEDYNKRDKNGRLKPNKRGTKVLKVSELEKHIRKYIRDDFGFSRVSKNKGFYLDLASRDSVELHAFRPRRPQGWAGNIGFFAGVNNVEKKLEEMRVKENSDRLALALKREMDKRT